VKLDELGCECVGFSLRGRGEGEQPSNKACDRAALGYVSLRRESAGNWAEGLQNYCSQADTQNMCPMSLSVDVDTLRRG
jgi:hypothetical protein